MVKMQNVIPPGWVLPAGGSRLIPATAHATDAKRCALPLYLSGNIEKSPNQMPLMLDLRELAADRDKKRDVAAWWFFLWAQLPNAVTPPPVCFTCGVSGDQEG